MRTITFILLLLALLTACAGEEPAPDQPAAATSTPIADQEGPVDDAPSRNEVALTTPTASPTATTTPVPTPTSVSPLGDLRQELDIVEYGADENTLAPIPGEVPFYAGNVFRAREGGEGLLDFTNGLVLRLFNNARLSSLQLDTDNTSREMRMFLWEEGFTADYEPVAADERLTIDVMGGPSVTILGTRFFVVYDPLKERTTVANFDGAVQIDVDGLVTNLQAGYFTRVPDEEQPGPQHPIPESSDPFGDFELRARELQSAIAAADEYPELEIDDIVLAPTPTATVVPPEIYTISASYTQIFCSDCMSHLWEYDGNVTWQGQLSVSGGAFVSGTGTASFTGEGECGPAIPFSYQGEVPVTFEGFLFDGTFRLAVNMPTMQEALAQTKFSFPDQCLAEPNVGQLIDSTAYAMGKGMLASIGSEASVGTQVPLDNEVATGSQRLEITITPVN